MYGRFRTASLLVVSLLMMGSMASADAGWQSGRILESFRSWLGQPANRTKLTVEHTSSGVVLELTSSDTATVNRLQAALPERQDPLGNFHGFRKSDNKKPPAGQDRSETENDRDEHDENCTEDDKDHGSS